MEVEGGGGGGGWDARRRGTPLQKETRPLLKNLFYFLQLLGVKEFAHGFASLRGAALSGMQDGGGSCGPRSACVGVCACTRARALCFLEEDFATWHPVEKKKRGRKACLATSLHADACTHTHTHTETRTL